MELNKYVILVKGDDKTANIERCEYLNEKWNVKYSNSPKVYDYDVLNIKWLENPTQIGIVDVMIIKNGKPLNNIQKILDFNSHVRVFFNNNTSKVYNRREIEFVKNCLSDNCSKNCFEYLKEVDDLVSLKTDDDIKILAQQYNKMTFINEHNILAKYLLPDKIYSDSHNSLKQNVASTSQNSEHAFAAFYENFD